MLSIIQTLRRKQTQTASRMARQKQPSSQSKIATFGAPSRSFNSAVSFLQVKKQTTPTNQAQASVETALTRDAIKMMQKDQDGGWFEKKPLNRFPRRLNTFESAKVADYNAAEMGLGDFKIRNIDTTVYQASKQEHPVETMAKLQREQADVYGKLTEKQLVITNLPESDVKELRNPRDIQAFLRKQVNPNIELTDVKFIDSVGSSSYKKRTAYIKLTLGSKKQVQATKAALRQVWLTDAKLKVKTMADVRAESFDNRTVVLRNIPAWMKAKDVLNTFMTEFGAVVGVELPSENIKLKELRREQENQYFDKNEIDRHAQLIRAQEAVQDALKGQNVEITNAEMMAMSPELQRMALDDTPLDAFSVAASIAERHNVSKEKKELKNTRIGEIMRLVTTLQAEGSTVLAQKLNLLELKEQALEKVPSEKETVDEESLRSILTQNKEKINETLIYLKRNSNEIRAITESGDPFQKLVQLGKTELAYTYDQLIFALRDREAAIEKRLEDSIHHYGLEERILTQARDWNREMEDMPEKTIDYQTRVNTKDFTIDNIMSVSQQIKNIDDIKNPDPESKFVDAMKGALNPFKRLTFNRGQMRTTTNREVDHMKRAMIPDPRIPQSLQDLYYKGSDFYPEEQFKIDILIDDLRRDMQLPFDEMYHMQKRVIQDVIDSEKALKDKEDSLSTLNNLVEIDLDRLSAAQRHEYQDVLDGFASPFEAALNKEKKQRLNDRVKELSREAERRDGDSYEFALSETDELANALNKGLITREQESKVRAMIQESYEQNMGYAFVTFSHADEAQMFLIDNKYAYFEQIPILVNQKTVGVDHGNFDMTYFLAKLRNEAQTVNELEAVRDARKRLRDFEADMDAHMPNRRKLQEFRHMARSLIEDHPTLTNMHNHWGKTRDDVAQKRLDRKIKEFEAKNPHIDLTSLYDSEQAEGFRKQIHKRAFASYKAYHFLKTGTSNGRQISRSGEKKLSKAKQRLIDNDPYNFPEMDNEVAQVLSKDVDLPRLNDHGDYIKAPGRRFQGYTQQEYLDSFFGKDMARRMQTEIVDDPGFLKQKTLKEKYPLKRFLKMPRVQAKIDAIKEAGLNPDPKKFPYFLPTDDYMAKRKMQTQRDEPLLEIGTPRDKTTENFEALDEILSDEELQKKIKKSIYYEQTNEFDFEIEDNRQAKRDAEKTWKKFLFSKENKDTVHLTQDHYDKVRQEVLDENRLAQQYQRDWYRNLVSTEHGEELEEVWNELLVKDELAQYDPDEFTGYNIDKLWHEVGEEAQNYDEQGNFIDKSADSDAEGDEMVDAKFEEDYHHGNSEATRAWRGKQKQMSDIRSRYEDRVQKRDPYGLGLDDDLQFQEDQYADDHLVEGRQSALEEEDSRMPYREIDTSELNTEQMRVYNEFKYDEQHRGLSEGTRRDPRLEKIRKYENLEDLDMINLEDRLIMKDLVLEDREIIDQNEEALEKARQKMSGSWFRRYQTGAGDAFESEQYKRADQKRTVKLDEFVERDPASKDEQEQDIYQQYVDFASRRRERQDGSQADSDLGQENDFDFKLDQEKFDFELPRMGDYFEGQAKGVHPFDNIKERMGREEDLQSKEERQAEKDRDEELFRRVLEGRFYGQTLTPRQFEMLTGMHNPNMRPVQTSNGVLKDDEREMRKIAIRLQEERFEKLRRQKVISGEWSEQESMGKLRAHLAHLEETAPTDYDIKKEIRDMEMLHMVADQVEDHESLMQREYFFDEGLGVSIDKHIQDVKEKYPSARVQMRRDRDGFAIIRLSQTREYKYDMGKILAFDPEKVNQIVRETDNALAEASQALMGDNQREIAKNMTSNIDMFLGNQSQNIPEAIQIKLNNLVKERVQGKYSEDLSGFMTAFDKIVKQASKMKQSKKKDNDSVQVRQKIDKRSASQVAFDQLIADHEILKCEMAEQMRRRIRHRTNRQQLKEKDLIQGRHSEESAYDLQKFSATNQVARLEKEVSSLGKDQKEKDFDREAYEQIKSELKRAKQNKESLLSGGLPQFKAYLRM